MQDAHSFLQNLALVFCVAALTTIVFHRLRQPVVFGYLLAGMIVGPHLPVPLVVDEGTIRTLSELGVILLMFSLGLEFRLRRVVAIAGTSGLAALAETSLMLGVGFVAAQALGWTTIESVFTGAMVAISSTTIVAKAFAELKVTGRVRDIVFGILVVEDLIAILLVAMLTAVAAGGGMTAGVLLGTSVRLATFLAVLIGVGALIVPRLVRVVTRAESADMTLVTSIGICFAAALAALAFGYSVALGAFIAGSLVAESGESARIEPLIEPVRDLFLAIFFVSVGMLIDPATLLDHWGAVLTITLVVIVGKFVAVTMGAFITSGGLRTSIQAGMSLTQIGEFSFIIAAIGTTAGVIRPHLYPIAIAASAITTLTTPWLIRGARPLALWMDRSMPKPVQTFVALYGSWIEQLRASSPVTGGRARIRRLVRLLVLDAVLLGLLILGVALEMQRFVAVLGGLLHWSETARASRGDHRRNRGRDAARLWSRAHVVATRARARGAGASGCGHRPRGFRARAAHGARHDIADRDPARDHRAAHSGDPAVPSRHADRDRVARGGGNARARVLARRARSPWPRARWCRRHRVDACAAHGRWSSGRGAVASDDGDDGAGERRAPRTRRSYAGDHRREQRGGWAVVVRGEFARPHGRDGVGDLSNGGAGAADARSDGQRASASGGRVDAGGIA